jgi:acyl CoA:acetate/3-ketoacid CoA transferase beta subunit
VSEAKRHEICAVALAEVFRGDGEILASPIGVLPVIGARLAKLTFEPDLLLTDGVATLLGSVPALGREASAVVEGYMPYRTVFDVVWSGRRHVIMGASQIDRFGNQNIAFIGDPKKPKAQLLGMRGAPGNTLNHPTSYFIPNHGPRVFVERVDVVSGVGYDRARKLEPASARFHSIRRVVTNLAVLDFETPDRSMRLVSVHPGVSVADVTAQTGFALSLPERVPETRSPSDDELRLIREVIDPDGRGAREIAA